MPSTSGLPPMNGPPNSARNRPTVSKWTDMLRANASIRALHTLPDTAHSATSSEPIDQHPQAGSPYRARHPYQQQQSDRYSRQIRAPESWTRRLQHPGGRQPIRDGTAAEHTSAHSPRPKQSAAVICSRTTDFTQSADRPQHRNQQRTAPRVPAHPSFENANHVGRAGPSASRPPRTNVPSTAQPSSHRRIASTILAAAPRRSRRPRTPRR